MMCLGPFEAYIYIYLWTYADFDLDDGKIPGEGFELLITDACLACSE